MIKTLTDKEVKHCDTCQKDTVFNIHNRYRVEEASDRVLWGILSLGVTELLGEGNPRLVSRIEECSQCGDATTFQRLL